MKLNVWGAHKSVPCRVSILPVHRHFDKAVRLHTLDAKVPVTGAAPPAFNSLCLVKPSDAGETRRCALYFVTAPSTTVVQWSFMHITARVWLGPDHVVKGDVLYEAFWNGFDLFSHSQIGEVYIVEACIYCRLFIFSWHFDFFWGWLLRSQQEFLLGWLLGGWLGHLRIII